MPRRRGEGLQTITDAVIIAALKKTNGLVTRAAKLLRCAANTIYAHIKESQEVRDALRDAREELCDDAEQGLKKAIKKGDLRAIVFTMETLGRDRGFVKRTETRIGGDSSAPPVQTQNAIELNDLPLDLRKQILAAYRAKKGSTPTEGAGNEEGTGAAPSDESCSDE